MPIDAQRVKALPKPSVSSNAPGYVGSAACATCHADIYREFKKTAMGHSIVPANAASFARLSLPAHFTNSAIHRQFDVFEKNGTLYESEYAVGPDSTETFRDTRPIRWLIGAGINGYGPVIEEQHYLFQAPLSFYTKTNSWGPSPGYEGLDLGFNRPILTGCIFCHSGRANPVAGTNGEYQKQPFTETSVGCENCHGPGAAHIRTVLSGNFNAMHIVNPAKLPPYLADNICMACHQTGDVRVLKPGKSYSDIRPGRPLDDVLSIFLVPPTPDSPPNADHVEHYYSMILSKCYRASKGRLSCLSCHDPHMQPTEAEAPAYYNRKCMACHTTKSCRLPMAARLKTAPKDNCIGCHMPKRDIQVISHSTATNHRIVATPDEPFPEVTFHQTTAALPDLIHLDPAPGQKNAQPPLLTLLQAYGQLAAEKPQYVVRYLDVLSKLEKTMPDNAMVEAAVGRRNLKQGDIPGAIARLQRAMQLAPPQATTCADLAEALEREGQSEEAIQWLDKSIALDPFNPFTQRTLIVALIRLRNYPRARAALKRYVQTFPQDEYIRRMLAAAPPEP
jgi:Tetratricopeptide repeat/Cytochrome c554 and c-prime